jgi:soluble lytic murein transglycosylase-like protein
MRLRLLFVLPALIALIAPRAAAAAFIHVVSPGESLYSIAAADGLSVDQLAAANGIPVDAQLVAGSGLAIPPQGGGLPQTTAVAVGPAATGASTASGGDGDADSDDVQVDDVASTTASAGQAGAYVVQPGDTLSAIAARAGTSIAELASVNGIDPNAPLLSGAVLHLAGTGSTASAATQPVGAAAQGSPVDPPYPTSETVSASQVGSIAAANGVSPSLADAIAYQESGFNNDAVSTADARGVMQILPGTWTWIQRTLVAGGPPLAPASAADNVRGGVLMLRSLLSSTGGDPALAAAGYYQGLPSVQRHGVYPSTQQYVNSVLALRQRFGGG